MIQVNGFIINEKLIKVAMPWFEPMKEGSPIAAYPPPKTKIIFTDSSEMILELPCNCIYDELKKLGGQGNEKEN